MADDPAVVYLTTAELAQRWRISHNTLGRWRSAALGPAYIKLEQSGRCLYPLKEIEHYEQHGPRAAGGRIKSK